MAQLGQNYAGEESKFEPIPPGDYPMQITASSMEATKDGRGRYLKLEMEITEGQQAGRKISERLNLENPNAQAVEIAQRTLRAIVFAAGLSSCTDSEQLHMRKMLVRVNVKERKDQPGTMSNEIGGYKQAGGGSGAGAGGSGTTNGGNAGHPGGAQDGAAASGGDSRPPWKR